MPEASAKARDEQKQYTSYKYKPAEKLNDTSKNISRNPFSVRRNNIKPEIQPVEKKSFFKLIELKKP